MKITKVSKLTIHYNETRFKVMKGKKVIAERGGFKSEMNAKITGMQLANFLLLETAGRPAMVKSNAVGSTSLLSTWRRHTKKEVMQEINHIKKHATKKEIERLSFNSNCPYFEDLRLMSGITMVVDEQTALEEYILLSPRAKGAHIVAYIKGEIKTLNL